MNRYLREVIAEAEALRIPLGSIKPEVRINSRAKKRFGCCRTEKTFAGQQYEIELSQKVLACKEKRSKKFWHMRFCIAAAAVRIMERNGKHTQTR